MEKVFSFESPRPLEAFEWVVRDGERVGFVERVDHAPFHPAWGGFGELVKCSSTWRVVEFSSRGYKAREFGTMRSARREARRIARG